MSEPTQQPLTREQLAREYDWEVFPVAIQEKLFLHSQQFTYGGDYCMATMDLQSVSHSLHLFLAGTRIDTLLIEHRKGFGQSSAEDLATITLALVIVLEHHTEQ